MWNAKTGVPVSKSYGPRKDEEKNPSNPHKGIVRHITHLTRNYGQTTHQMWSIQPKVKQAA